MLLNIVPKPLEERIFEGIYTGKAVSKVFSEDKKYGDEGYSLTVNEKGITITAKTEAGLFYGEVTLKQLFLQFENELPYMEIFDKPLYAYRGFMLDCSRHFFGVEEIKRQIELAAMLKLNKFHWHITDEQGWRMEIKAFPLLTEIGSKRTQTMGDGTPVEGYFTVEQIADIVSFCKERYIEVIPEVDMPGHFAAAIAAYPYLGCTGERIKVRDSFGISQYIACAGRDETYDFCFKLFDEMEKLFPSSLIHLGGDEAMKAQWQMCDKCRDLIKIEGLKDEEELQGYFMSKMIAYLADKGKTVINWNDGLVCGNVEGDLIVQFWKENSSSVAAAKNEIKNGRKVIISPFSKYYLDYEYGMTPLKKTYAYEHDFPKDSVLGLEAPLWTEYIADRNRMDYMLYPRLLAVAERAWSEKKNYAEFLTRKENFYKLLSLYNVNYAKDPDPNFIKGSLQVIKFFAKVVDKTNIANSLELRKAQKKAKKLAKARKN